MNLETIHTAGDIDIDWLKNNHTLIHYFGLGFIQIKINQNYRLHFYTEKLPKIVDEEEVHNHRYSFTSKILYGKLIQRVYTITETDEANTLYTLEEESCNKEKPLHRDKRYCSLHEMGMQMFIAQSKYNIHHSVFHKIDAHDTITLIKRGEYMKENAEVIRHKDANKICPFSQVVDEKLLWNIVEEMLTVAKVTM